ncbi:MAG: ABC transporter ATP-binding protein [Bacteroidetes bacterium]|nr:ABC transporter ATP-binding protein [Bacteroidota bacterium]
MLQINNLNKTYGKIAALKELNIAFNLGEIITIVGPNGSGKTTLLKSILGLVIPDSGTISIDNKSIKDEWQYRAKIGYMPQINRYPENLKVKELFTMMRDIRTDCNTYDNELFETYKIKEIYDKTLGSLSGGMKQKVSAALAFLFSPIIIIIDEPTAGLDPVSSQHLKDKILKEKANGKLILITTHIMDDIDELADKIVFIVDGVLRFNDTKEALKNNTQMPTTGKALTALMEKEYV